MLFNSATFIIFLAIVLGIYYLPLGWRVKKFHLLVSSYIFYAAWNPPFVILIWISTLVDWFAAKGLGKYEEKSTRRWLLLASLCTNLGLLGYFKYGGFLMDQFVRLVAMVGIEYQAPDLGIVLPVGISFYTFQTLSYTIDVYRRDIKPWPSLLDFALFVTFFPQLVAGPIVRAKEFLPQLKAPIRATADEMGWGLTLLTIGLFEKIVLADSFVAPVVDAVYGAVGEAGAVDAWIGTLAFSAQVFFDFAGYSACAIGVAMCFGFALPDNFRAPFAAIGFADLWRRWHISLSSWLRDYLYFSLGGSRVASVRLQFNTMLTMLLCGLWHGAAWHFVAWGGMHGVYLLAERWVKRLVGPVTWVSTLPGKLFLVAVTYYFWCLSLVAFRARNLTEGFTLFKAMFGFGAGTYQMAEVTIWIVVVINLGMLVFQWFTRDTSVEDAWRSRGTITRALLIAAMLAAIIMSPGEDRAFIYFQF